MRERGSRGGRAIRGNKDFGLLLLFLRSVQNRTARQQCNKEGERLCIARRKFDDTWIGKHYFSIKSFGETSCKTQFSVLGENPPICREGEKSTLQKNQYKRAEPSAQNSFFRKYFFPFCLSKFGLLRVAAAFFPLFLLQQLPFPRTISVLGGERKRRKVSRKYTGKGKVDVKKNFFPKILLHNKMPNCTSKS